MISIDLLILSCLMQNSLAQDSKLLLGHDRSLDILDIYTILPHEIDSRTRNYYLNLEVKILKTFFHHFKIWKPNNYEKCLLGDLHKSTERCARYDSIVCLIRSKGKMLQIGSGSAIPFILIISVFTYYT